MNDSLTGIPRHVAIIMDGNRRWSRRQSVASVAGHRQGARILSDVVHFFARKKVSYLSLFAFSTENWQRPAAEVQALLKLLEDFLKQELIGALRQGVSFHFIGDLSGFSAPLQTMIRDLERRYGTPAPLAVQFMLNYGGKADILKAARSLMEAAVLGKVRPEDLSEDLFKDRLWTKDLPSVDLLIRTGREQRLSNFMLWHMAYAELFFLPVLWPDVQQADLQAALDFFAQAQRRFGGGGTD